MQKLWGYIQTLYQYMQTPKGHHDFWDDIRAFLIIVLTIVIVLVFMKLIIHL
jgi:hypothetical protein